jgi:hypothetical protein
MLKQFTALFLLLAFSMLVFNQAVIVVDYYVNNSSFAKNCENKSRPMMHCNGKCQMMKMLKAEEKKDQQNPERRMENKNDVTSSKSFFPTLSIPFSVGCSWTQLHDHTSLPRGNALAVFHPPA